VQRPPSPAAVLERGSRKVSAHTRSEGEKLTSGERTGQGKPLRFFRFHPAEKPDEGKGLGAGAGPKGQRKNVEAEKTGFKGRGSWARLPFNAFRYCWVIRPSGGKRTNKGKGGKGERGRIPRVEKETRPGREWNREAQDRSLTKFSGQPFSFPQKERRGGGAEKWRKHVQKNRNGEKKTPKLLTPSYLKGKELRSGGACARDLRKKKRKWEGVVHAKK